MALCQCGCDKDAKLGNKYIVGHNLPWNKGLKGKQIAWNKGLKGVVKNGPPSLETREKISKANKGHLVSDQTRTKLSLANKGNAPGNKGKRKVNGIWIETSKVEFPLCECGCGQKVRHLTSKFAWGHYTKINNPMKKEENQKKVSLALRKNPIPISQLCECGCGQYAKSGNRFLIGHCWNDLSYRKKTVNSHLGRRASVETRQKMARSSAESLRRGRRTNYRDGHFFSKKNNKWIYYRSSYELLAFQILEQISEISFYSYEPLSIPYQKNGIIHYTVPDILVVYKDGKKELIEVKPEIFVLEEKERIKFKAMKEHCDNEGWKFSIWTEKELGQEN